MYHVHGFPPALTTNDIKDRFAKKALGGVFLRWINDTSVLVTVLDKEKALLAVEAFKDQEELKIEPFGDYAATKANGTFAVPQTPQTPSAESNPVTPVAKRPRVE